MQTAYRLNANEIDIDLLRSIQALYHDKWVEIRINETAPEPQITSPTRKAGALKGRVQLSPDFNQPLADMSDYES